MALSHKTDKDVTMAYIERDELMPEGDVTSQHDVFPSVLLGAMAALIATGFVFLYSASALRSTWELSYVERQFKALGCGILTVVILSRIDYRYYYRFRWMFAFVAMALLVAVLIPGVGAKVNGARRWFRIGSQSIQPSELVKLFGMIAMAGLLYAGRFQARSFGRFLVRIVPGVLMVGLVALEPDMGTAALLTTVFAAMIFCSGIPLRYIMVTAGIGIPPVAFLAATRLAYISGRIEAWLSGSTTGKGYHAWMSTSSLGSGGWFGVGLGRGEANMAYLPEAHTDFIYAVVGQESGLVGSLLILGTFAVFLIAGLAIARRTKDGFGSLLAFGLTLTISLQAAFNIAVVTASMPTKGIPLPFMSYGGTGLVCNCAAVGLMMSIARFGRQAAVAHEEDRFVHIWSQALANPDADDKGDRYANAA